MHAMRAMRANKTDELILPQFVSFSFKIRLKRILSYIHRMTVT